MAEAYCIHYNETEEQCKLMHVVEGPIPKKEDFYGFCPTCECKNVEKAKSFDVKVATHGSHRITVMTSY